MKSFAIKEASIVSDGRVGLVFVPYNIPPQLTDFKVNLEASTLALKSGYPEQCLITP